jgi:hypothetical protein
MKHLPSLALSLAALLALPAGASTLFSQDFNGLTAGGPFIAIPGSGFHVVDGYVQVRLNAGTPDKYLHLAAGAYAEATVNGIGDTQIESDLGFDLLAGHHYTLSFDWSRGPVGGGNGPFALTITALMAGQSVSFNDVTGFYYPTDWHPGALNWLQATDQAGVRLRFIGSGTGYSAAAIDNLRLDVQAPVPEPGTWALMLAGIAAVATGARQRRA